MIRTTAIIAASFLLAACASPATSLPPVSAIPTSAGVCEAMANGYPIKEISYSTKSDSAQTVAEIKAENAKTRVRNARFAAACS